MIYWMCDKYQTNEENVCVDVSNGLKPPVGKNLWGFAYTEDDRAKNYYKKPVLGRLIQSDFRKKYYCGDATFSDFYELKKNGEPKSSGVSSSSRNYADTYEEAVLGFNLLITKRIARMNHEIERLKEMLIE